MVLLLNVEIGGELENIHCLITIYPTTNKRNTDRGKRITFADPVPGRLNADKKFKWVEDNG